MSSDIEAVYNESLELATSHYENFPVVSFFVKKELQKHVAIIYRFARTADDIADEGDNPDSEKIELLNIYEKELSDALRREFAKSFWKAVKNTIDEFNLTPENLFNLIKAFKQDTEKKKYNNYVELLGYCENSANPVGRIILEINGYRSEKLNSLSDNICTALQLTNFYQDVNVDNKKNRIYLPNEDLVKFGVTEEDILNGKFSKEFKTLLKWEVERTEQLFIEGSELVDHLRGRLKIQIKWTILGGMAILQKIKKNDYNVFQIRPKLSKVDLLKLMLKSFYKKY